MAKLLFQVRRHGFQQDGSGADHQVQLRGKRLKRLAHQARHRHPGRREDSAQPHRSGIPRRTSSPPGTDIYLLFQDTQEGKCDVIIVDECQFLTESQIDQLRALVNDYNIPVMCFGLRTDFQTRLFPGSRRLMEVADTIQEIKTICDCGAKATVNARIDGDGHIITQGAQVVLGGNDSYIAMCHKCYIRGIQEHRGHPPPRTQLNHIQRRIIMELKDILAKCDHTLLTQTATWAEIKGVCDDGMKYHTASVCIPRPT